MMSNNKILTVSYGTFSCTLEGFDDSFGTMKAIAEYFRGLSSDAPYFGAEPPQPDAEMLARIAQKEISRRVEAREHEGKIHLSAIGDHSEDRSEAKAAEPPALLSDTAVMNTADAIADTAKVAAAVVAPAALAETDDHDTIADTAHVADVEEAEVEEPDAEPAVDAEPETPIHAEVEAAEVEVEKAEVDEVEAAEVATVTTDDSVGVAKADTSAAETSAFVEDENDIVPGQSDADVEAFFANSAGMSGLEEEDQELVAEQVEPRSEALSGQNDSIAAKLQRIRAVVAQHDEIEDDFVEDQHTGAADALATEPAPLVTDARRDIEDALDADEAVDMAVEDTDEEDDDDDIAAILSRLDAADSDEQAEADEDIVAVSQASDATDDTLNNLFGENDDEDEDEDDIESETTQVEASDTVDEVTEQDSPRTPRARVIKVKRADLEAAIENGELEEYVDGEEDDIVPSLDDLAPAKTKVSSLSAEDEAELARELAELEADMSPVKASLSDNLDDADDLDEAEALDEPEMLEDGDDYDDEDDVQPAAATSRRVLPSIDEDQGEDMDRLLAETDHQMDEPESATRRNAFSHLRAAVAAKKADVAMGTSEDADEDDNAYRNDLADVVRPRRPVSTSARTERPGEGRPAPLKLVAEQRIDVASPRPAGPVRPRRVAAASEAATTAPEGESFADYAAEMGATKLPQLLEAAAAYMSFVEGREQFSRPQLMTKVRQVGPEDGFSREDGLRSFGQLLRAGKIEKIKGGRFTVSEDIGYRPDHRAAG